MKPIDSGKAQTAAEAPAEAAPAVSCEEAQIDFSNVKIEPIFRELVDFDTFAKADYRAVKILACEAVPKSKKLLKFTLDDGERKDRVILSGIHEYYEPEDLVGKPMTENKTVEAEYSRWTESIVGTEVINGAKTEDTASESSDTENEKAVFLLEGKFYDDTSIQMAECDTDLPDGDVVYAYDWSLEHLHDKIYDTVKAHFYVPDTSGKNEIWYRETGSDAWTLAETTEDGSYLVADIPYEAAFALVHTAADHTLYYAGGGAAVVLLLIVLIIRKRRKRAQKK